MTDTAEQEEAERTIQKKFNADLANFKEWMFFENRETSTCFSYNKNIYLKILDDLESF